MRSEEVKGDIGRSKVILVNGLTSAMHNLLVSHTQT